MRIGGETWQKTCVQRVHIPTELPFCTPPLLVGRASNLCMPSLLVGQCLGQWLPVETLTKKGEGWKKMYDQGERKKKKNGDLEEVKNWKGRRRIGGSLLLHI